MLKALFFCLLNICLYLSAYAQGWVLDQMVSLQHKQAVLEEVLGEITRNYQVDFSYSRDLIPLGQKVSIQARNQRLEQVLKELFANTGIEFSLIGGQVVLKKAAFAQQIHVLKGKVTAQLTGEPLAYASVQVSRKALGTTTLVSGEFSIKILPAYLNDTLLVSYMGYQTRKIPIATLLNQTLEIQLAEETRQLGQVVVQALTGTSILEQAIAKIPQNYDTAAFNLSFFLREWVFHDGGPIRVNEAVYEGYRGPLSGNTTKGVKLLSNRNKKYYAEYQGILSTFPHWSGYEVFMNRTNVLNDISALFTDKKDFLLPNGYLYHNFELAGTTQLNGREVYIIHFDQKDKYRHKSLYKGALYIDKTTMAIIKSVVDLSPKGIKNARFFNAPKAAALLLGFGKCAVTKQQVTTTYKERLGKWYVDSLQTIYEFHLVKDKWKFDSFVYYKADVTVTDIRKDALVPISHSDEVNILELHQEQDDTDFWQAYTAVEPDPEFELAFQQIDSLNKLHTYNDKFWKRYKMANVQVSTSLPASAVATQEAQRLVSDNLMLPFTEKKESRHFRFIYTAVDTASIKEISSNLEHNYSRIVKELEVDKQPKVEVTIYPSIRAYHLAINHADAPLYEIGSAINNRAFRIVSPNNPGPVWSYAFVMKAFVHEFTHCVHYTILEGLTAKQLAAISADDGKGAWLAEALACYEAGQFFPPAKYNYLQQGNYPSLSQLMEDGKIYDIGYLIIEYIKSNWGTKTLNQLIRKNGNIQASLGISEEEFEKGMYTYIRQKYMP